MWRGDSGSLFRTEYLLFGVVFGWGWSHVTDLLFGMACTCRLFLLMLIMRRSNSSDTTVVHDELLWFSMFCFGWMLVWLPTSRPREPQKPAALPHVCVLVCLSATSKLLNENQCRVAEKCHQAKSKDWTLVVINVTQTGSPNIKLLCLCTEPDAIMTY